MLVALRTGTEQLRSSGPRGGLKSLLPQAWTLKPLQVLLDPVRFRELKQRLGLSWAWVSGQSALDLPI